MRSWVQHHKPTKFSILVLPLLFFVILLNYSKYGKKEKFFFIILPLSRGHRDPLYFVTLNGIWTMILSSYGFLFLWWINSMTKSKLWRTGTFWLILSHCSQSFKEVRIETQIWQECGGRSSCRGHGEVLFNDLLLMPYSACFLIECKTTSPCLPIYNVLGPPLSISN